MSELRECPFCGGEAKSWHTIDDFWCSGRAGCKNDGCYIHPVTRGTDEDAAIRIWNTRAERTCENASMKSDQWLCSECGGNYDIANIDLDPDEDSGIPNYCPNCGAKVVSE